MFKLFVLLRNRKPLIGVFLLLLFFSIISASSVQRKYLTVDESVYIAAGYSYLKTGDFRVNVEHPVLGKALSALPLLFFNPSLPLEKPNWEKAKEIGIGPYFGFAADFYEENSANFSLIVFSARMVVLLLTLFLGILIFLWSRELFGLKAGLLSLFLFVFSPNIIAHSRIASLDMPLTVFVFASFYFAFIFARSRKLKFLLASSVFISLAVLTKFTALIFFPLLFLFLAVQYKQISKSRAGLFKKKNIALYYLFIFSVLVFVPLLMANMLYAFDNYEKPAYYGVIPARMLDGFAFIQGWVNSGREGYLFGEFSSFMPEYFLSAFLMKSTIPFIALLFASFYFLARKPDQKALALLIPAMGFFLIVSLFSRFYLGFRYILPILPFLFVFCGILLAGKREKIVFGNSSLFAVFSLLVLFHAFSSLSIYPNYLAYFNEFIGPKNATEYLSDSNLDWGQDMLLFMDFAREKRIERVNFIYFGWPFYTNFPEAHYNPSCKPVDGNIAISATALVGIDPKSHACFEWLRALEPKARIGYSIYFYEVD